MTQWTGEEVAEGIERWLKLRRDEQDRLTTSSIIAWDTADRLLDEVRDCAAEGWMPWQRLSTPDDN